MTFDYSTEGKVIITMDDYVDKLLADLPEDMIGMALRSEPNKPQARSNSERTFPPTDSWYPLPVQESTP